MKQWLVLVAGAILASCGSPDRDQGTLSRDGSPSVTLLDSTVLAEPDTLPLGTFVHVARDGRGRIYLNDGSVGRVLRFAPSGALEAVWGRKGSGPGEFQSLEMLHFLPGDTLGVVMDNIASRLSVIDLRSGEVKRSIRTSFMGTGKQWHFTNDKAVFSLPASPTLVGTWDLRDDSISVVGALPASLMEAFPTYMQYGHLEIIPWRGGYLAQIPTLGALQLLDSSGTVVDEIPLPAVRRRGQTDDLLVRQQQREADGHPFTHLGSAAATLGVLSTGEVVSVQVDIDTERTAQGREFRNLRYYVSILSSELRRACLDALVPFTSDAPFPIPHLAGDTLVALSRVVGVDDSVRTVMYRFGISSQGCVWVTL